MSPTRRGRPAFGPAHVERLEASEHARQRLRVVLETVAGALSVDDACATLGIGPSRFHALRQELLQAAAERADGVPAPSPPVDDSAARLAALEAENQELRIALEAARIREEIAVVLPHLQRDGGVEKKGRRKPWKRGKSH